MSIQKAVWKLFSVQKEEYGFAIPLFFLYVLSGSFYTIGQIFTETLFLKTYGAQGFSLFFMQNGIALILAGILYNYFMLRMNLRKGYLFMILLFSGLIVSAWFMSKAEIYRFPFYLYMANYLFTFFLDIHFYNFAYEYMSLRNSKRILPFLIGGGKFGGIAASLMIFTVFSGTIIDRGIIIWAANGLLLIIPVWLLSLVRNGDRAARASGTRDLLPDIRLAEKIIKKLQLAYTSPIFTFSMLAVFVMSVANQLAEYYFARAFNRYFATSGELAAFLSVYTFTADLLTLLVGITLTARIIRKLGVKTSNMVYPVSFVSFMTVLVAAPGLVAGILLRFYRKNLSTIIRTPIFNIIMASAPRDRMAEVRSFISAIISPVGMVTGGALILLIYRRMTETQGYLLALAIGLVYIALTLLQNRAYVSSLKNRLSFDYGSRYEKKAEFSEFEEYFTENLMSEDRLEIIGDIFNDNPSLEALERIYRSFQSFSIDTKLTILNLLNTGTTGYTEEVITMAIGDSSPEVRSRALYLLKDVRAERRREILMDSYYPGKLTSERFAISWLLNRDISNSGNDEFLRFARETIDSITAQVIDGSLEPVEFTVISNALPHKLTLEPLLEVALSTGREEFLESLIPVAHYLSAEQAEEVMRVYRDRDIRMLVSFFISSGKLSDKYKTFFLDMEREIPEARMEQLFRYGSDEGVLEHALAGLKEDRSLVVKSNYLNFLMAANIKPLREMTEFINRSLEKIARCHTLAGSMELILQKDTGPEAKLLVRFLAFCIRDSIEQYKHLILKAVAIITGVNIDNAYESNLLLKDRDLNSFILEYIESAGKHPAGIVSLFEDQGMEIASDTIPGIRGSYRIIAESMELVKTMLPGIPMTAAPLYRRYRTKEDTPGTPARARVMLTLSREVKDMLNLYEKILFLKDNDLFSGLNANDLLRLAHITNEIEAGGDRLIIKKDDLGDELFILIEGEVEVFTEGKFIDRLGPGSCIGELSLVDSESRSANVKTTRNTRLLSIKRKDFLLTLRDNPAISINIMKVITGRLRNMISS